MKYITLPVGDKEYKLRLTSQACVGLEKKLKTSLFNALKKMDDMAIETIVMLLHSAMQALEHGITLEKTYAIYDELVDEGKKLEDIIEILFDILEVSGFFKKEQVEEAIENVKK